jgi:hypothetical protein
MSNSSQPKNSYDTLITKGIDDYLKDCTIDLGGTGVRGSDITITNSIDYQYNYTGQTITLSPSITSIDTITINDMAASNYTFNLPQEWVDTFPVWNRVQDMCEQYPGLKVAFDNFKVFYEMVKDDYDNPTPKK